MINTLIASVSRVTLFWYGLGVLVLFLGSPEWAEARYRSLLLLPWVPEIELRGLATAASVQWNLLVYWTVPMLFVWMVSCIVCLIVCELKCQWQLHRQRATLRPTGEFWGVTVATYSLGHLPRATTPALKGAKVSLSAKRAPKDAVTVELQGSVREAVKLLTPAEQQLCEELIQLLLAAPDHYAGLGHGVGLLEHTLNVVAEAAEKCTAEFRLPFVAALAHDIGKLITFKPDGKGGWQRKGLHSRESARILVTLPGFQELPQLHQNALLLAVKYDHAPSKMPELAGNRDACMLAMRIINALSQSDKSATAAEKERHLERLKPEDLLFKDFVDFLREAPVVQRGKPGVANQLNNPEGSPYLYIYEAAWRDAAVRRLPAEVAAALDLTRRDAGKLAKYTKILAERLRKDGLLVETHTRKDPDGTVHQLAVSESNPLWDIQSGTGEKAVVLRGILIVHADALWKAVNFRLGTKSPYPVEVLAPNADPEGRVNSAPAANREAPVVDTSDSLKLSDIKDPDAMATIGLVDSTSGGGRRGRTRGRFQAAPSTLSDDVLGLEPAKPAKPAPKAPEPEVRKDPEPAVSEPLPVESVAEPAAIPGSLEAVLQYMKASAPVEAPSTEEGVQAEQDTEQPVPAAEASVPSAAQVAELDQEQVPADPTPVTTSASPAKPTQAPRAQEKAAAPSQPSKAAARRSQLSGGSQGAGAAPAGLSWSEKQAGLAIADEEALKKYPHLQIGDKFYTEDAPAVKAGQAKPGSRYRGAKEATGLTLSADGPRRVRRKPS